VNGNVILCSTRNFLLQVCRVDKKKEKKKREGNVKSYDHRTNRIVIVQRTTICLCCR
jgi:hypothetical protein